MNTGLLISLLILPFLLMAQNREHPVNETALGYNKVVELNFEQALSKLKTELKKEGFGVLTEVDIKDTFKKKLDVDFRPYQILGVCNPQLARRSILAEEEIGLMLPCKFIVYVNKQNKTVIAAVDPVKTMAVLDNKKLAEAAELVQLKFKKVMDSL